MLAYKNWRVLLHWGSPQHSNQQPFKAPWPSDPSQITEGKKLVEPAEVSNGEEDKAYFLDQEYSGLYNE